MWSKISTAVPSVDFYVIEYTKVEYTLTAWRVAHEDTRPAVYVGRGSHGVRPAVCLHNCLHVSAPYAPSYNDFAVIGKKDASLVDYRQDFLPMEGV
jgi:hypothetical protein